MWWQSPGSIQVLDLHASLVEEAYPTSEEASVSAKYKPPGPDTSQPSRNELPVEVILKDGHSAEARPLLGSCLALLATAFLSGATVIGKSSLGSPAANDNHSVGVLMFWRMSLATPIVACLCKLTGETLRLPNASDVASVTRIALFYSGFQGAWCWGIKLTTPFIAAISSLTIPVRTMQLCP